jgi:hypothetical protein
VHVLTAQSLVVLVGFTHLAGLGSGGVAWVSERLSWEGLRIREISGKSVRGAGWDAIADQEVEFTVDLETGRHSGGARP